MRQAGTGLQQRLGAGLAACLATAVLSPLSAAALTGDPEPVGEASACLAGPPPRVEGEPTATAPEVPALTTATRIHWTRATRWLAYGEGGVLEGQVVTEDGAVRGAAVDLYERPAGAPDWTLSASTRSDEESGVFVFECLRPERTTGYRVVHESSGLYGRSADQRRMAVRRLVPAEMRRVGDSSFLMHGRVSPRYDGRVELQRRSCRRCSWSTVDSAATRRGTRWRLAVDAPARRGRTWFRAMVPAGDGYARSHSPVWRISVG